MELRIAAVLLMLAGWILMLCRRCDVSSIPLRSGFSVAGLAVEMLGFVLLARTYIPKRKKHDA